MFVEIHLMLGMLEMNRSSVDRRLRTAENAAHQDMIEEGVDPYYEDLGVDRPRSAASERYPHLTDSPEHFMRKKSNLLSKVVPISVIPMATANGMLILGTKYSSDEDCYFGLANFLIVAGSISLGMTILGVVSRNMLEWFTYDKLVTRIEAFFIKFLEVLGLLMSLGQILILFAGLVLMLAHLPRLQWNDANKENYCNFGIVVYTTVFFGMCNSIVVLGLVAILVTNLAPLCVSNK